MIPVKICGITRLSDAREAERLGAAALGFVFYEQSPRYITPENAAEIIRKTNIPAVGVFVNEDTQKLARIIGTSGIDMVQLHGDETGGYCSKIELPVIKALRVRNSFDPEYFLNYSVQAILLDSHLPGEYGGTGRVFNWKLIDRNKLNAALILAGGLNPANVARAVDQVKPAALDVSSGVEKEPGIKDHGKLSQLFAALQGSGGGAPVFIKRAEYENK